MLRHRRRGRARSPTSRTWPAPCRCRTGRRHDHRGRRADRSPAIAARPATPTASEAPADRDQRRASAREPVAAPGSTSRPTSRATPTASMVPATRRVEPALLDQHQRDERHGAVERRGEQEPAEHHRRQAARHPQRAAGQQPRAGDEHPDEAERRSPTSRQRPARAPGSCGAPLHRARGHRDHEARAPTSRRCSAARWSGSLAVGVVAHLLAPAGHDRHRHGDRGDHDEEDPPPRERLGQPPGDRRPDQRRQHPRGGDPAEHPGAQLRRGRRGR